MRRSLKILIGLNVVLWGGIFLLAAINYKPPEEQPIMQIKVNVCKRYIKNGVCTDPETCEYFRKVGIMLYDRPGGLEAGAKYVGSIPACDDIVVDVLEIKEVNGLVFYKVRYGDLVGWQTKRLLTGEE